MIQPSKASFSRLAGSHTVIPIFKTVPADLETPVSIYLKVAGQAKNSFLLESGDLGEEARYSFIGCDPYLIVVSRGSETTVTRHHEPSRRVEGDPIQLLQELVEQESIYMPDGLDGFWGGAAGYLAYDLVRYWEKIPGLEKAGGLPSLYFFFPRKIYIYDHRKFLLTAVYLLTLHRGEDPEEIYERESQQLRRELENLSRESLFALSGVPGEEASAGDDTTESPGFAEYFAQDPGFPREDFMKAVVQAKAYIEAGEIFQVVLSRRRIKKISCHPFTLYRTLRSLNPSPYQFYFNLDGFQLIGASPEMLVKVEKGRVYTKPIAGTRPRGINEKGDLELARELSRDEKERAEHMMLVDLGRNDLGKISAYGSVEVTKLLEVEYFSHVMHLVSEVVGSILPNLRFDDAIRAAFPAGTVSGAPKVRAMEIIAELEPAARGPYSGAVGYVSFGGKLDTCITIRTIVTSGGYAAVQAGAGIVADSDPAKEYEETEHKMAGSLKAIQLAEEREHALNY